MKCTRKIHFCAGHRVLNHESKCANLHGHNYVAWITAEGALDDIGRVIDFSVIKQKVGAWIDENWDHKTILYVKDQELRNVLENQKVFELDRNPTAENMAHYLLHFVCPKVLKDESVKVTKVVLFETENCYAEVSS